MVIKIDKDFALGKKQKPLHERFQLLPAITPEIQNNHSYLKDRLTSPSPVHYMIPGT